MLLGKSTFMRLMSKGEHAKIRFLYIFTWRKISNGIHPSKNARQLSSSSTISKADYWPDVALHTSEKEHLGVRSD